MADQSDAWLDEEPLSYVDQVGEWKTRKISMMGVVKSFVSQLTVGQDLTRVTLPSQLVHPYSMLEVIGHRYLGQAPYLYGINDLKDPLERFLQIVRRYLSLVRQEEFEKKPYNPVLGETHQAWIESDKHGRTTCLSEQVSHHPPVAAFFTTNDKENSRVEGNISFNVRFAGNSVSVTTEGKSMVYLGDYDEVYEMSKGLPDMIITNVILGTKRVFWDGDVSIDCKKTGYYAKMTLKNANHKNIVEGYIAQGGENGTILFDFEGRCGEVVNYWPHKDLPKKDEPSGSSYYMSKMKAFGGWAIGSKPAETRDTSEDKVLMDISIIEHVKVKYLPYRSQDELSSLRIWRDVSASIIANDMPRADVTKKAVEDAQRRRIKEHGQPKISKYFIYDPEHKYWAHKAFLDKDKMAALEAVHASASSSESH